MKIYDRKQLQDLLGVGKETAYRILQDYGFRTGYTAKSPLRITEEQVRRWAERRNEEGEVMK